MLPDSLQSVCREQRRAGIASHPEAVFDVPGRFLCRQRVQAGDGRNPLPELNQAGTHKVVRELWLPRKYDMQQFLLRRFKI